MKRLFFWGRLLLGGALIGFLFYSVDLGELREATGRASGKLLLLAYFIGIIDRILMAYKWSLLLRAQSIMLSLWDATTTYLMATFLGLFLPSTVGGDAIRAFAVSKFGYPAADAASTIIIERAIGILALIFMVVASIGVGGIVVGSAYIGDLRNILVIVGTAGGVGLLLILLSFNPGIRGLIRSFYERPASTITRTSSLSKGRGGKIGRFLIQLSESYGNFATRRGLLFAFFGLSLLENLFPIAWSYILALAFQLQVSLLDCFVVVPSVLILRRLPISIDGIGIHQTAFVYLLSLTGVPGAQGLLLGIATHLLATTLVLPGGLFYMWRGITIENL